MQTTTIPGSDKPVSRILFGTASNPFLAGTNQDAILDDMVSLGITAIDTARVYGDSEKVLGGWFARRKNRESIYLVSKCAHPDKLWRRRVNEKAMRSDLETSLKNLGTDYIDLYLLHRDDPAVPAGEIVEILYAMKKEGKILSYGGSNWTHERIQEANDYALAHGLEPFVASSPNFTLGSRVKDPWGGNCVSISGAENQAAQDFYRKTQLPVLSYSSLAGGFFSGKLHYAEKDKARKILDGPSYKAFASEENFERLRRCEQMAKEKGCTVSQLALSWIFHSGLNVFAIISASTKQRMLENAGALDLPLSEEECRFLQG